MADVKSDNKTFVRKFFEAMDTRDFGAMEAMLHPDHQLHLSSGHALTAREHMEMNRRFQSVLPIVNRIYQDQIECDDKVVTRGRLSLHHIGEFSGCPATNKIVELSFIHIMRIKDGRNIDEWDEINFIPLIENLGFLSEGKAINWN